MKEERERRRGRERERKRERDKEVEVEVENGIISEFNYYWVHHSINPKEIVLNNLQWIK